MKVILISNSTAGKVGDIVEVKDGYARNFLIPTKKAIHYSKANYASFEEKKKEFEAKNAKDQANATETKKLINNKEIIIIENASDDGRLYGAVNSVAILAKITEISKDLNISKSDIILEKPIKDTGVYDVTVNLYVDITATLKLVVARNESEVATVKKHAKETQERAKEDEKKQAAEEKTKTSNVANDTKAEAAAEETKAEATETKEEATA